MKFSILVRLSIALICLLHAPACGPAPAQEAATQAAAEIDPKTLTLFGERVLLFTEYPHLVRGQPARFLAHLTVLATGEPVRSGHLVLQVGPTTIAVDGPKRDGLFTPEGSFPEVGDFTGRLVIESDQVTETLDLGTFTVHADEAEARAAAEAEAGDELPGGVPFLLEQQWKLKLLLARAEPRQLARRLIVPARAMPAQGSEAIVSAPVAGRIVTPADRKLPHIGERVEADQLLALLEPPLSAPELAQLRTLSLEFDLRSLEVEQAAAEAAARVRFAEADRARIAELRKAGLSTQQQLDQAEQDLVIARSATEAATGAKAALERLRAGRGAGEQAGMLQVPLRAPIAGGVVEADHVVGESVAAGTQLFRILDSSLLWIEGRVSEFDLPGVNAAPAAVATFPALPSERFELGGASEGRLLHVGSEVDESSRTVVIRYELLNEEGNVRAGMLADLELVVGVVEAAVAIPFDAVVMDQGMPTAYVMLEGELFQKRDLELGERDGNFVEVLSGVTAGERVATRGSATIRMVALSPASFGHGHQH